MTYTEVDSLEFPEEILKVFNIRPDVCVEQIEDIENFITSFPEGHEFLPTTYFLFGVLFARVLKKDFPGIKWDTNEFTHPGDMALIVPTMTSENIEVKLFPATRAYKFSMDHTDSLMAAYYLTEHLSHYDVQSKAYQDKFVGEDGWVKLSNGAQFRMSLIRETPGKEE